MPAQLMSNQLSDSADANGNASMQLAGNYELNHNGAWNIFVQLQGIQNAIVTVLVDGMAVDGGLTTNRQFKCGPVFLNQNSYMQINVTGMTPSQQAIATMQGVMSDNVSDFAILSSPGYGGGSVQSDPSQLLTAQTGPPLIENVTAQIPHLGLNPNWLTFGVNYPNGLGGGVPPNGPLQPFNIAGYSALFIDVDPNTSANDLWMIIEWQDVFGNIITTTEIGSLCPLFRGLVIAHGTYCTILIVNNGAVNHGIGSFTVVPYVQVPAKPDLLLDNGPLITPIAPAALDSHFILSAQPTVAFGTTSTVTASLVWNGRAIINIGTAPTNNYHVRATATDALGNAMPFDDIWHTSGGDNFPHEVQLPAALVSLAVTNNNASGNISPTVSIVATS
jgi:hypothetical protein